jgi:16S rRNA A1518/A1519 N6-dimethyltransferase RsmA/KsgA/DIM1 with predicted DNA glycosylase/AP lyase activity
MMSFIEVGPGLGVLTDELVEQAGGVIAVDWMTGWPES